MSAPKPTPYAPIDPDLGVEELRLLARRYQVERDVARAGERAATAMAADVAARVNGALEAYRVEVETAMRAAFDGVPMMIDLDGLYTLAGVGLHKSIEAGPGNAMRRVVVRVDEPGKLRINVEVEPARPVLTEAAAREAVEAIVYVLGRSPFAMVRPLVALLVGRPAAGVRAPEALTEEAARAMVDQCIADHLEGKRGAASLPPALARQSMREALAALLLRVVGPVTAEQGTMAAAFDAAKEGAA